MLPSKLISAFVLSFVTFIFVEASKKPDGNDETERKPKGKVIRRRNHINAEPDLSSLETSIPSELDLDSPEPEKDYNEDLSAATLPTKIMTSEEYTAHRNGEEAYGPVDMAEMEREMSQIGEDNFMVKIMKRYRRDLGYKGDKDFVGELYSRDELLAQLMPLLECFGQQDMSIFETIPNYAPKSLLRVIEAFNFLRFLDQIPSDLSEMTTRQCQKLKNRFTDVDGLLKVYQKELKAYTRLNWDFLDLTHFEYQKFPVVDHIVKTLPAEKNYERRGVFTVSGAQHLKKYLEHIRFHNRKTDEGCRMLVFQKLYHVYFKALGRERAHPNFIDWGRCTVTGWPKEINKVDMETWTIEQMRELLELIKDDKIKFCYSKKNIGAGILGIVARFDPERVILADFAFEREGNVCTLSDSEEVCGKTSHNELMDESKTKRKERLASERKEKRLESKKAASRDEEWDEAPISARRGARSNANSTNYFPDEEETEWGEGVGGGSSKKAASSSSKPKVSPKNTSAAKSPKRKREPKRSIFIKVEENLSGFEIKIDPNVALTAAERAETIEKVTELYFEDTEKYGDVDWSSIQLTKFKNHIVPFNTDLRSSADIQIVKALIEHEALAFLNPELNEIDAQIKTYERVYSVYFAAFDWCANHYDVYFEDVIVEGWPAGVGMEVDEWTREEMIRINEALDSGAIKMKATPNFQREMNEALGIPTNQEAEMKSDSLDSVCASEEDSPQFKRSRGISIMPDNEAKDQVDGSLVDSNSPKTTPGFETYIGSTSDRKMDRDSDNEEGSSSSKMARIQVSGANDSIIEGGADQEIVQADECEGSSIAGVNYARERVRATEARFVAARDAHSVDSRQYRIYSMILECINVMLQHLDAPITNAIPSSISIEEASEYLRTFVQSLLLISEEAATREFVVAAVKLRARLAGCPLKMGRNGKFDVTIRKAKIVDTEIFPFLSRDDANWPENYMEILESSLLSLFH